MKKESQPLEFKQLNPENLKIGSQKKVNPLKLIQPQQNKLEEKKEIISGEGTFVGDYLLQETVGKGKRIVKQDPRKNYKTKMCPYGRQCRRKLTCTFAHSENQLRKPFIKRKTLCKQYQMGKCHLGSACREYHGNIDLMKKNYKYKAEICKDFQQGKCLLGNVCIYIHEIIQPSDQQQLQVEQQRLIEPQKPTQEIVKQSQKVKKQSHEKKEIIEVVEQKIGEQQFVQNGFTFTFNFN